MLKAGATEELAELAELTGAPVVTTLMARGAFPDSHPQNLGMPGMHGNVTAVTALQKADLLVALGARFDDRVTGQLSTFAPDALVVHADIDPAEIGKNRKADVPIVGDARETIVQLVEALRGRARGRPHPRPRRLVGAARRLARSATRSATTGPRTARCRRSTSSSGSARSPARTRSTPPAWASTRCGPRSS